MFNVANNFKTVLERRLCPALVLVRGDNDVDMFFSKLILNTLHLPKKVPHPHPLALDPAEGVAALG